MQYMKYKEGRKLPVNNLIFVDSKEEVKGTKTEVVKKYISSLLEYMLLSVNEKMVLCVFVHACMI